MSLKWHDYTTEEYTELQNGDPKKILTGAGGVYIYGITKRENQVDVTLEIIHVGIILNSTDYPDVETAKVAAQDHENKIAELMTETAELITDADPS